MFDHLHDPESSSSSTSKAKHPPLKAFNAVSVPISRLGRCLPSSWSHVISVSWPDPRVENIDLLGMAPQGEASVDKMNRTDEFDARSG